MKKLIAIAVVFVLAVGVAFADFSVGGQVSGGVSLLKGDSKSDTKVGTDGRMTLFRLHADGQDEDGKFGFHARFGNFWWAGTRDWGGKGDSNIAASGNVWWKPIDQFKLQIGGNGKDGFFDLQGDANWNFYKAANDSWVVDDSLNGNFGNHSFYGGIAELASLNLSIYPIDAMEINIGVPIFGGDGVNIIGGGEAKDIYAKTHAQVAYNISNIGKVAVTYVGNLNKSASFDATTLSATGDGSKLYAFFNLTAVENLDVALGLGYQLPVTDDGSGDIYRAPVALGLSANFTTGALGIKARLQGEFAEKAKVSGTDIKGNTSFIFELLPSFAINDQVSALLAAGINMTSYSDDLYPAGADSTVAWHINPYVTVKSNWWAPNFYAGVRFESAGKLPGGGDAVIKWSIPIGLVYGF